MMAQEKTSKHKESYGSFLFMLLCVLMFRMLVASPYRIPSGSMIPTLLVGDYLVVARCSYGWGRYNIFFGNRVPYFSGRVAQWAEPQRGDVVVFTCPYNTSEDFIKRLIALPQDKVKMEEGRVWLNGQQLALEKKPALSPYKGHDGKEDIEGDIYEETLPTQEGKTMKHLVLKQHPFGASSWDYLGEITVPVKHFFFLGDNRDGSDDSRFMDKLGCVSQDFLIGKALMIHYSVEDGFCWYRPWTWAHNIRYQRIFTSL